MKKVYLLIKVKQYNYDGTVDGHVQSAYACAEAAIEAHQVIVLRNASHGISDSFYIREMEVNP